jgi:hypothetical protein
LNVSERINAPAFAPLAGMTGTGSASFSFLSILLLL